LYFELSLWLAEINTVANEMYMYGLVWYGLVRFGMVWFVCALRNYIQQKNIPEEDIRK
jgi:cytochrome oxidase assembly protein ShyY1